MKYTSTLLGPQKAVACGLQDMESCHRKLVQLLLLRCCHAGDGRALGRNMRRVNWWVKVLLLMRLEPCSGLLASRVLHVISLSFHTGVHLWTVDVWMPDFICVKSSSILFWACAGCNLMSWYSCASRLALRNRYNLPPAFGLPAVSAIYHVHTYLSFHKL